MPNKDQFVDANKMQSDILKDLEDEYEKSKITIGKMRTEIAVIYGKIEIEQDRKQMLWELIDKYKENNNAEN